MSEESRKAGTLLRDSEITESIIAAAIAVHRELGPGFLESVYEQALAVEFAIRGIAFVRQQAIPLFYRDHQIGEHRLDFVVEGKIVVELKAVEALENVHFAIVRSYLKAAGLSDGLILNFASMPLTVKRVRRERGFENTDLTTVRISCVPAFHSDMPNESPVPMFNVQIDGVWHQFPKGTRVIEACEQVGVFVPRYCYHKSLARRAIAGCV